MIQLTEDNMRAKIVELLDGMNQTRMDLWLASGVTAGVIDSEAAERILLEELPKRSHEVREFWDGPCDLCR